MTMRLPVLGLLTGAILPGGRRCLERDDFEPASLALVEKRAASEAVVLALESGVQFPGYLRGVVGVACTIARVEARFELCGVAARRVTAVAAKSPHLADLEAVDPGTASPVAAARLLAGLAVDGAPALDPAALLALCAPRLPVALARQAMALPAAEGLALAAKALGADPPPPTPLAPPTGLEAECLRTDLSEDERTGLAQRLAELRLRLGVLEAFGDEKIASDLEVLRERLEAAGLPIDARRVARRQLRLLRTLRSDAWDYSTFLSQLDLLASLPWKTPEAAAPDFRALEAALEREHQGLVRPKKRVLEHLAVATLGGDARGMVLCLSGPPGVGKTSLARAIAAGLGRKLVRIPLGGVHDECEIRGHRMSFHAAAPGRIIRGVREAGRRDAVILLDEIDKLGTDGRRSPSAALLEVLDPEQHHAFEDNFLAVPYDLSGFLFITTANDPSRIEEALRDRLEIVELDGYLLEEKLEIARRHLLPRLARRHGLSAPLEADHAVLTRVIEGWTREAGVRELERVLAAVHRDRCLRQVRDAPGAEPSGAPIDQAELQRVLGVPRFRSAALEPSLPPGSVRGLWTNAEGAGVLVVETVAVPGEGKVVLTGSLGPVMREAAEVALARVRADAPRLGIDQGAIRSQNLHLHVPEGATPKEGPSAGLATYLAFVSLLTGRAARADVAVTGELALRGAVLPVGGVRAKIVAAERAGLCAVVVPDENRAEAPEGCRLQLHFVRTADEARAIVVPDPSEHARASSAAGGAA